MHAHISNPSRPLWAAVTSDPAFIQDRGTAGFEPMVRYISTRALSDLAEVPVREGQGAVLVELAPLSAEARAAALSFTSDPARRLAAFRYAARRVLAGGWTITGAGMEGPAEELDLDASGRWPILTEKATAKILELVGGDGIEELGSLAIQRASVHPRALGPFRLPSLSGGA